MKSKSITISLTIFLFILGISEFISLLMKFQIPNIIILISRILLFTVIMSSYFKITKLRKLAYPIIIIFYFIGMPIIQPLIYSKSLYIVLAIASFIIVMIFIYVDLMLTNKENKLMN